MGADEGTEAGDKLDILLIPVEDYEDKHHRISPPDPVDAIKFRMEQMNLTRKDLEPCIGNRDRVSEIFKGRGPKPDLTRDIGGSALNRNIAVFQV